MVRLRLSRDICRLMQRYSVLREILPLRLRRRLERHTGEGVSQMFQPSFEIPSRDQICH